MPYRQSCPPDLPVPCKHQWRVGQAFYDGANEVQLYVECSGCGAPPSRIRELIVLIRWWSQWMCSSPWRTQKRMWLSLLCGLVVGVVSTISLLILLADALS